MAQIDSDQPALRIMRSLLDEKREDPTPGKGEASVTFITDRSCFILIKRNERSDDPWSGQMALPGGYRKAGETSRDAAKREAYEEVGVILDQLFYVGVYTSKVKEVEVKAFISEVPSSVKPLAGNEISEAFWVPVRELIKNSDSYLYGNYRIWGMTFRILLDILG